MIKKTGISLLVIFLLMATYILYSKTVSVQASSETRLRAEVEKNIKEAELIDLTQRLVRIMSDYDEGVAANHKEIANFLADYLRKMGMEVHVIEPEPNYPTVIARLEGSEGTRRNASEGTQADP